MHQKIFGIFDQYVASVKNDGYFCRHSSNLREKYDVEALKSMNGSLKTENHPENVRKPTKIVCNGHTIATPETFLQKTKGRATSGTVFFHGFYFCLYYFFFIYLWREIDTDASEKIMNLNLIK